MGGSSDDAGLFEFDQLSGSESDSDPSDPPDPPDGSKASGTPAETTPDEDAGNEPTVSVDAERVAAASSADASSAGSDEPTAGEDRPPEGGPTEGSGPPGNGVVAGNGGSAGAESAAEGSGNDDPPDPPDTPDGGASHSWTFDPVEESQAAFQFAEQRSRAVAESAYTHGVESPLGWLIKRYTTPEVRERLDEVFSRRMLGSVMVGGAFSKVIESVLGVTFSSESVLLPIAWALIFVLATVAFVWWEKLARQASEAAEKASEAASEAAEKASETAEKASETAEKATEAASEATSSDSPGKAASGMAGPGVAPPTGPEADGATAATRAGGERPSAVRSRSRTAGGNHRANTPERRPNKRFENEGDGAVPYDEVVDEGTTDPTFAGGGIKNAGDAEEIREGSER